MGLDWITACIFQPKKSETGIQLIRAMCKHLDPDGMMNPGKLVE